MVRKAPAGEDPQSVAFDYAVTVWLRVNRQDYLAALMINARTMRQELLDRFA